jgi:hypothetical protein
MYAQQPAEDKPKIARGCMGLEVKHLLAAITVVLIHFAPPVLAQGLDDSAVACDRLASSP